MRSGRCASSRPPRGPVCPSRSSERPGNRPTLPDGWGRRFRPVSGPHSAAYRRSGATPILSTNHLAEDGMDTIDLTPADGPTCDTCGEPLARVVSVDVMAEPVYVHA